MQPRNARHVVARWWPLFLISTVSLFLELAVVRWVAGEVRLLSYFKNMPLLAAFLGLAIGFAIAERKRDQRGTFAPLLIVFVLAVLVIGRLSSPLPIAYPAGDQEWLWHSAPISDWIALIAFHGILLITVLLTVLLFIPVGQSVGREMAKHAPLPAYMVNILGSLAGVWGFSLISFLETPPAIWFGIAVLGISAYLVHEQMLSIGTRTGFALVVVGLVITNQNAVWSPYHRLDASELKVERVSDGQPVKIGYVLDVQQVFYQHAIDLSDPFVESMHDQVPQLRDIAYAYGLPYQLAPDANRVLIVGAGMGNDVAAALRAGMPQIDAVEIDPSIVDYGRQLHPEQPYQDHRVRLIVDDARSFFQGESGNYDIVAFGLLDSQTLLSSLSSVRLDSFVYTVESFEQVKKHLAEDGVVAVTFARSAPWIEQRIGRTLGVVFGADRVHIYRGEIGDTFVTGDVSAQLLASSGLTQWQPDDQQEPVPLATDDWPYLYLRSRQVPSAYLHAIVLIGIASLAMIARSFPEALRPDWHFWLLGAAFLLIEFKSITELALLFGTTWLVNALAISGVLVMILAANLLALLRPRVNLRLAYGLLFASLILSYFLPLQTLSPLPSLIRAVASTTVLSIPLFFAGLIFAESLRRAGQTSQPLASNLSGTVAGGLLEYSSLQFGIKSLYPIALLLYVGSLVAARLRRQTPSN